MVHSRPCTEIMKLNLLTLSAAEKPLLLTVFQDSELKSIKKLGESNTNGVDLIFCFLIAGVYRVFLEECSISILLNNTFYNIKQLCHEEL